MERSGTRRRNAAEAPVLSIVDRVHAQLRREILEGFHRPGASLSVATTATRMSVSAVPVREALRRLEGERLVRFEANLGAIVVPISVDDLRDIYETRKVIEAAAVRVTVETNAVDKTYLADVISRMADAYVAEDHSQSYALHREFHHLIVNATAQPRLHTMTLSLLDASDRYLRLAPGLPDEATVLVALHKDIADAILASDAQGAYEAVVRHMDYSLGRLGMRHFTHELPPLPQD